MFYVLKGDLHIVASEAFKKKEYSMNIHGQVLEFLKIHAVMARRVGNIKII